MNGKNIIITGVGGQGILTIAYVLVNAAHDEGLYFKQSEVHGMSQRGGAVQSHVRFSKESINSGLIPEGQADLIVGVEPLEAIRYADSLKDDGTLITNIDPFKNIPNYPEESWIERKLSSVKNLIKVDAKTLAQEAGNLKAQNTVLIGASSCKLGLKEETLKKYIEKLFVAKGEKAVKMNLHAFELGLNAAKQVQ